MSEVSYSTLARAHHIFYKLYFPHTKIASTLDKYLKQYNCKQIVFFGGFIQTAKILQQNGYKITFVDYTKEMVDEAKKTLKDMMFVVSDMRTVDLDKKFDAIILMGRIMTYMYTDKDVLRALRAFKNNLKIGGIVLFDNYETGKMGKDEYFNGTIQATGDGITVHRISTIKQIQLLPSLYNWDAIYEIENGKKDVYEDNNHILRAVTKEEIKKLVEKAGLKFIKNAPNFEKRSFITLAQNL